MLKRIFVFLFFFALLPQSSFAQAKGGAAPAPAAGGAAAGGGGGLSTGRFEAFLSGGFIGLGKVASEMELGPGLQMKPLSSQGWLQVGAEIMYQKLTHQGGTTKNTLILVGVTGNFGSANVNDAAFISVGLADRSGSSDVQTDSMTSPDGMGYYLVAGKKIALSGGWSLRPSIGIVNTGENAFLIRPLAVSYHF